MLLYIAILNEVNTEMNIIKWRKSREVWRELRTQRLSNQNFISLVTLFFMTYIYNYGIWISTNTGQSVHRWLETIRVLQPCLWVFRSTRRCCFMLQTAADEQPDSTARSQGWLGSAQLGKAWGGNLICSFLPSQIIMQLSWVSMDGRRNKCSDLLVLGLNFHLHLHISSSTGRTK